MNTLTMIILIISMIVSALVCNKIQRAYMAFIGADVMIYNKKIKVVIIIVLGVFIYSVITGVLGLSA